MKKNVLVTGGAGFVGTNLIKKLQQLNFNVIALDNLSFGNRDNFQDGVEYIVDHTKNISKLNLPAIDLVFHLGEYSKITPSFSEIDYVFELNIIGTFNVLEYCRHNKIPLVYSSSSTRLAAEGDGHSPYSFMKSVMTQMIKNYGNWYGLKFSICYFYNVYGPFQDTCKTGWETVISIFEKQYKNGKPLTIVGDGEQSRDFTYVGDIVEGLLLASDKLENDEYQLGSGKSYRIIEVAKFFSDNIIHIEQRQGDRKYGQANVSETFEKLNWKPKMNLENWIESVKCN
jgi:UDP-glucose 4-epimerase